jgi:cell division protein FtsW
MPRRNVRPDTKLPLPKATTARDFERLASSERHRDKSGDDSLRRSARTSATRSAPSQQTSSQRSATQRSSMNSHSSSSAGSRDNPREGARRRGPRGAEARRPVRTRPALPDNVVDLEAARVARRERLEREDRDRAEQNYADRYFAAREGRHARRSRVAAVDDDEPRHEDDTTQSTLVEAATPTNSGSCAPCHLGLFVLSMLLTILSVPLIYSASTATALDNHGAADYFLKRQIPFALVGMLVLIMTSRISGPKLRPFVWGLYAVVLIGLFATDFTPLGLVNGNVKRWLKIGPVQLQFSELAKIALIGVLADYWSRTTKASRDTFRPWAVTAVLTLPIVGLVFLQPHLSAAVLLGSIAIFIAFFAGVSLKQMSKIGVCLILLAGMAVPFMKPYQRERVVAHLNILKKDTDEKGSNYQALQGQRALVRGGLFGTGPGGSLYKQGHLPAPHTDFILAVIGEEWGLVGMLALLTMYGLMIFFCFHTGHSAATGFEAILCAGVGSLLAVQVVGNMGVVTGVLPVTGMPLPLLTYGGSGMLSLLLGLGLVLSVSRRTDGDGTADDQHATDEESFDVGNLPRGAGRASRTVELSRV